MSTELNEAEELQLQDRWTLLQMKLREKFGKALNLEGIIFLIGVRELGAHPSQKFTKEQKQDLMHIALCAILAPSGYFKLSHQDQEGWPHYEELQALPFIDVFSQELFLKSHILDYFEGVM